MRTTSDHRWVFVILTCALLLRLPMIAHPNVTQFDEVFYVNFVLHMLNQQPPFDIHPPLARIMFTEIARGAGSFGVSSIPVLPNQGFKDFPFIPLRLFVAFLGSLLPLLVYTIGRILNYRPRSAALPALFVVIDNAFIIYSRAILPDTILLFFNFLALGCAFAMIRVKSKRLSLILLITGSIAIGCALSIKWLALGVLATIWLLLLSERRYGALFASGVITLATYVLIFTSFFFYFPQGGHLDPMSTPYTTPLTQNITFPKTDHLKNVLEFLPKYHQLMLNADRDKEIAKHVLQGAGPLAWPTSLTSTTFWVDGHGKGIVFQGNGLIWIVSFLLLLFHLGWICWHMKHKRKWPLDRDETILLAGYIFNYVPFFFIHRPMHLYHYFTALIFLFLMIPKIAPRMLDCIACCTRNRLIAVTLLYTTLFLIFIVFVVSIPLTYGL